MAAKAIVEFRQTAQSIGGQVTCLCDVYDFMHVCKGILLNNAFNRKEMSTQVLIEDHSCSTLGKNNVKMFYTERHDVTCFSYNFNNHLK